MNRVYFHVAAIGRYREVNDEIMRAIKESGLGLNARVSIGLVGKGDVYDGMPVDHVLNLGVIGQFEFPTLKIMQDCAKENVDDNFLYIHTKGVSTPDNQAIVDWRKYMTHFCVERWVDCVAALDDHDCAGVDWRTAPVPHYSGNFWWAKGSYLASLPDIHELSKPDAPHVHSVRHNAEFWIGMGNPKAKSLWDCGISAYERHLHNYTRDRYVNG